MVLDIGSNTGSLPKFLSEKAINVYGIEIEKRHYAKSKELESNNLTFINADATTYNYKNIKDLNVVTLSNVLEHIEHRVDFSQ